MAETEFDDRDEAVLEAVGGDAENLSQNGHDSGDTDDTTSTVEVPAEQWEALQERLSALEQRVTDLERAESGPQVRDSMTTLQKYSTLVKDGEGDTLGTTDRRAVAIHLHWDDLKEKLANGQYGVTTKRNSTKKNQPSQLKIELQHILDEELAWSQVYRAMTAVAELSGGEPEHDQYGRTHVVGGVYDYHEKATPDGQHTYKVLVRT